MNASIELKHDLTVFRIIIFLVMLLVSGARWSDAESWLKMTAYGGFLPNTNVSDTEASFSSTEFRVSVAVPIVTLQYDLTLYSWDNSNRLFLGQNDAPWEELQHVSFRGMYADKIYKKWAYLIYGTGSAAFEEQIDEAFLDGTLVSGMRYTLSEQWYLMFGGGAKANDFETIPFPAGGVQWNGAQGFSCSVIFPLESKISYESANQKLSASVDFRFDFPPSSARIAYRVSPVLEIGTRYASKGNLHRLSNDSLIETTQDGKTYLQAASYVMEVELSYSPLKQLVCHAGTGYHFSRELSLLDEDEESLKTFTSADAFGATFSLTYSF